MDHLFPSKSSSRLASNLQAVSGWSAEDEDNSIQEIISAAAQPAKTGLGAGDPTSVTPEDIKWDEGKLTKLKGTRVVGSYNWLDRTTPTIAVPGQ